MAATAAQAPLVMGDLPSGVSTRQGLGKEHTVPSRSDSTLVLVKEHITRWIETLRV